jgi:hypothetical protein
MHINIYIEKLKQHMITKMITSKNDNLKLSNILTLVITKMITHKNYNKNYNGQKHPGYT